MSSLLGLTSLTFVSLAWMSFISGIHLKKLGFLLCVFWGAGAWASIVMGGWVVLVGLDRVYLTSKGLSQTQQL